MTAANEGSHDVQGTAADLSEAVSFKVVYKKTTHDVTFCLQQTAGELKDHLSKLTGKTLIQSLQAGHSDFHCDIQECPL